MELFVCKKSIIPKHKRGLNVVVLAMEATITEELPEFLTDT